ncbi:hypothetical protein Q4F19_17305 [Sphingomonas sp. BIUV-7]|uniref:Uncharacterized protein n=1 Tax=Sphingomonas natans TaxID=3063330 RepID=A0ABT8YCT5_9SPHN|nr:hypothetical protein [Sphingomonas sp. BIUV-7]MDO6416147.1 hypothetical protein [Sphingomonas sp. BIUV-7]
MLYVLYFGFWAIFAFFAWWAWSRGGASERWAVGMMSAAALFTPLIGGAFNTHWHAPQLGILAVDCGLLVCLLTLAFYSRRFWPMSVASLQTMAVLTHPALWIDSTILPFGYALMQGFWSYPMMALVMIGARRHQLRRAAASERAGRGPAQGAA